jgi:hypothetical protein
VGAADELQHQQHQSAPKTGVRRMSLHLAFIIAALVCLGYLTLKDWRRINAWPLAAFFLVIAVLVV